MHSRHAHFTPPSADIERRIQRLIDQLGVSEKIRLLGGKPGQSGPQANSATYALDAIGLPELRMADGPMGVHWWCDASTAYPALIAAAASWDPELWYKLGSALGRDCRARGVHILLAPGVNIYRSALCGRNFEYAGEDPFLSSRFAVAYVRGVQDQGVSATVKHFAVNYQEYGRHTVSSDVDERTLHEVYLPAFKAAVTEGGCGALMTAYNLVNGVHCSEHPGLILETLKGEWKFDGVVMSDWLSTYSVAPAANAGLDLEMPTADQFTPEHLLPVLARGEVSQATLDDKVRRVLRLAACFGWLDHEQKDASIPYRDPATAQVALELARAGIVLLKNQRKLLPLDRARVKTIAVLGPYAHPAVFGGGGSSFTPPHRAISLLEGFRELAPGVEILHAAGPDPNPQRGVFASSVFGSAHGAGLWGEYFDNNELSGEPRASQLDERVDFAWGVRPPAEGITEKQFSIRWTGFLRPEHSGLHSFYSRSPRQPVPHLGGRQTGDRHLDAGAERATPRRPAARGGPRVPGQNRVQEDSVLQRHAIWLAAFRRWGSGHCRMRGAGEARRCRHRHRRLGQRERGRGLRPQLCHEPRDRKHVAAGGGGTTEHYCGADRRWEPRHVALDRAHAGRAARLLSR